ncbi:MAG: transposase [Candidatus Contendobacter sp.]
METRPFTPKLPEVPEREQTPLVRSLLQTIAELQEQNQRLTDEIRRLKGGPPRPQLKPTTLQAAVAAANPPVPRRRGHPQRAKTAELVIHETCWIELDEVPAGAQFQGYRSFVVQDVVIQVHNVDYARAQWRLPSGESVTAPVPLAVSGHYGPQLVAYLLHQHYHAHVTQPILLAQVREWGIQISAGQLNRLLTEGHEGFHQEKAAIKAVGLAVSSYVQTDDTGARHQGKNGYRTYLGNEGFAWFASTESKSRVNFLELLQSERCYAVNVEALTYMAERGVAAGHRERLAANPVVLSDPDAWAAYLRRHLVDSPRAITLVTEGALLGGLVTQGFRLDLRLLSDDAGQFALFVHALCWVHAERPLQQLLPLNDADRQAIAGVREQVWTLYRDLTAYREQPTLAAKAAIHAQFDTLCATVTPCEPLHQVLQSFQRNRDELPRVLDYPDLPLHNNRSENDLRDMVKKRKISAGTRSAAGRRCRDTFISLKKTCRKHGISFWEYLCDRVAGRNQIPQLPDLIEQAAAPA